VLGVLINHDTEIPIFPQIFAILAAKKCG